MKNSSNALSASISFEVSFSCLCRLLCRFCRLAVPVAVPGSPREAWFSAALAVPRAVPVLPPCCAGCCAAPVRVRPERPGFLRRWLCHVLCRFCRLAVPVAVPLLCRVRPERPGFLRRWLCHPLGPSDRGRLRRLRRGGLPALLRGQDGGAFGATRALLPYAPGGLLRGYRL